MAVPPCEQAALLAWVRIFKLTCVNLIEMQTASSLSSSSRQVNGSLQAFGARCAVASFGDLTDGRLLRIIAQN
jgi:hypothetical protein